MQRPIIACLVALLGLVAPDAWAAQPDTSGGDPSQPTSSKAPTAPLQRPAEEAGEQAPPSATSSPSPSATSSPSPSAPASAPSQPGAEPSSPRPTDRAGTPPAESDAPAALHGDDAKEEKDAGPFKHRGLILDVRVGAIGCVGKLCSRHKAKPGFRIDGFFGRNFLGFVDFGISGGYGTFGASVERGSDGLALYGLDRTMLPEEAAALNLDAFVVNDARLDAINGVLDLRVHFIPRGRFDPYAGVGLGYGVFRGIYDTDAGKTRVAFHGLSIPLQAGMVVFVHRIVAIGAQFDYLFTWYGGVTIRGAPGKLGAPISLIKDQARDAGVDLPGDLPSMWTVGGVVHLRFGK